VNDEHLRMSDAEREAAAAELGEHYAQGRLTTEEHAERLDRVWAARTRGELGPVFRDLPGRFGPVRPPAPAFDRPAGRATRWTGGTSRGRGLPTPFLAVLAVVIVLAVATHLPLVLAGLLAWCFVASRHRRAPATRHWSR
jgi:hypothetical protein